MWGIAGASFLFAASWVTSLAQAHHVEAARIAPDHRVHLRWTGRPDRAQRHGEEETGLADLRVAPGRWAAAWLVERTDLSDASYPESFELLVASRGAPPRGIFPGH